MCIRDRDGFIYITGRSKNVIVTQNGKNIYPEEIETLLSKVDEIAESMVYGKEVAGEKELIITARVIPNYEKIEELHGSGLGEDEIYKIIWEQIKNCLLYTSPSPRDRQKSRMPSSA